MYSHSSEITFRCDSYYALFAWLCDVINHTMRVVARIVAVPSCALLLWPFIYRLVHWPLMAAAAAAAATTSNRCTRRPHKSHRPSQCVRTTTWGRAFSRVTNTTGEIELNDYCYIPLAISRVESMRTLARMISWLRHSAARQWHSRAGLIGGGKQKKKVEGKKRWRERKRRYV